MKRTKKSKIEKPETTNETPDVEITSGVPIPPRGANRVCKAKLVLEKMFAGDSVLVPNGKVPNYRMHASRLGKKIATRPEGAENTRIWVQ